MVVTFRFCTDLIVFLNLEVYQKCPIHQKPQTNVQTKHNLACSILGENSSYIVPNSNKVLEIPSTGGPRLVWFHLVRSPV